MRSKITVLYKATNAKIMNHLQPNSPNWESVNYASFRSLTFEILISRKSEGKNRDIILNKQKTHVNPLHLELGGAGVGSSGVDT